MKKFLLIPIIILMGIFIASCEDSTTDPGPTTPTTGSLAVVTTPAGAQIWVDGTNTGKVTPDTIKDLSAGNHALTLKLDGYRDTAQTSVSITAGQTTSRNIALTRAALTFGPIRIWETVGTTAAQPSGLDLSTGTAIGVGSSVPERVNVDIYYSGTDFKIHSASNASGLSRITYFMLSTGTALSDGVDAPVKDNTWTTQMADNNLTNYVFLFDNDQHYSKIMIVNSGGGNPGNPAWVEVQLIYNEQVNSRVF